MVAKIVQIKGAWEVLSKKYPFIMDSGVNAE